MDRTRDTMKYRLAEAMKHCMKTSPLEKITVGAVRELAGREFDPLAVLFVFDRRDQA